MDESEYRDVYSRVINNKCVFEKAVLLQFAQCEFAEKRLLAEREAVSCSKQSCQFRCQKFLDTLRAKARFALGITQAQQALPHAKEIKVQAGGLYGLQQLLQDADPGNLSSLTDTQSRFNAPAKPVNNINDCLIQAEQSFGHIDNLPFSDIARAILRFEVRKKRR